MTIDNHNEAITNLAMPERRMPVLVAASSNSADGFVGGEPWSVRHVSQGTLAALSDPEQRKKVEQQYGRIDEDSRVRLLELIALGERLQAERWEPIIKSTHQSCQTDGPTRVEIDGHALIETRVEITGHVSMKSPVFALSEAFTNGLKKSRFVVWWAELPKKFAPGIYCEDISTALFALALSAIGQPGGIGVCQRCGDAFLRTRSKQRYCSNRCRIIAGMRRYRNELKKKAKTAESRSARKPKTSRSTKRKRRK
jgi:hypothetical protein